eukprot:jgi/Botrbrau1/7951/Bobra.9_2s0109.1
MGIGEEEDRARKEGQKNLGWLRAMYVLRTDASDPVAGQITARKVQAEADAKVAAKEAKMAAIQVDMDASRAFLAQRDALEARLREVQAQLANERRAGEKRAADAERALVAEKERARKELVAKVEEAQAAAQRFTESQLETVEKLLGKNKLATEEASEFRRALQLASQTEAQLGKRNLVYQRAIKSLLLKLGAAGTEVVEGAAALQHVEESCPEQEVDKLRGMHSYSLKWLLDFRETLQADPHLGSGTPGNGTDGSQGTGALVSSMGSSVNSTPRSARGPVSKSSIVLTPLARKALDTLLANAQTLITHPSDAQHSTSGVVLASPTVSQKTSPRAASDLCRNCCQGYRSGGEAGTIGDKHVCTCALGCACRSKAGTNCCHCKTCAPCQSISTQTALGEEGEAQALIARILEKGTEPAALPARQGLVPMMRVHAKRTGTTNRVSVKVSPHAQGKCQLGSHIGASRT